MSAVQKTAVREPAGSYTVAGLLSPFKRDEWLRLSPAERLKRSWRLRQRIPNLKAVHDHKLFPKP